MAEKKTLAELTPRVNVDQLTTRFYDWLIVYTPRLLLGLVVLFAGLWFVKLILRWAKNSMHRREVDNTAKPFLLSLVGVALRFLVVLATVQTLGFQMTLFTTIVGAFGVAAGLALSGTLQNFTSGILILLLKPFVVGDNIITQGQEGTVTSIQIFYTIITTFDNRSVIVPNSKLSNEVIINISKEGKRRLDIELTFPASIDFEKVKAALAAAVEANAQVLADPKKRIGIQSVEGDNYKVSVNVWVNAHGFQDTKLAIQERLLTAVRAIKAQAA